MRILTPIQTLGAAAVVVMLAGCSGGAAIAPTPASPQSNYHRASFYSCPRNGSIEYVSDPIYHIINVYVGKFAGQAPCGQITSVLHPGGVFVDLATHDLYVTSFGDPTSNVLVFHKGQSTPYNTYVESNQNIDDVALGRDGTVIASNSQVTHGGGEGSISTWAPGPNGGTFVGNFPMTNDWWGGSVIVKQNGDVYYTDLDKTSDMGSIWKVSCPAGVCGTEKELTGISFLNMTDGMVFDDSRDLLVADTFRGFIDTFELPNPQPSTFQLWGAFDLAIDDLHHHLFVSPGNSSAASEYTYPGMTLIGTVPPDAPGGYNYWIAVDP